MVHQAAREGNIPVMQAALDRRKFAIARDHISPNGSTPMHVATVFGKTNVMKYLGSKYDNYPVYFLLSVFIKPPIDFYYLIISGFLKHYLQ